MRSTKTAMVFLAALTVVIATVSPGPRVQAQQGSVLSPQAFEQINALIDEKATRTPAQQKMSSDLVYAARMARGEAIAQGVSTLEVSLPDTNGRGAVVDVRAQVSQELLDEFVRLGADVLDVSAVYQNVRLRIDVSQIEAIAGLPQVAFVQPKQEAITQRIDLLASTAASGSPGVRVLRERKRQDRAKIIASLKTALSQDGPLANVGSRNSEGDVKHRANVIRSVFGVSGAGVKVGVLSDGVTNLAASQALGDLGSVTVLPGQTGSGDEGTAMLEIIHDLAPGAQLYFATAFTSIASFAQNIRDLRTAGCNIIVDDVGYYAETPFQDGQTTPSPTNGGIVIQAVKDVSASGALYFSAAANSGSKDKGTSGTWEGDYVDAPGTGPLAGYSVHNFGGQSFDVITLGTNNPITLQWADPLGGSANDFDLYRLDATGTTVLAASTSVQSGTQDPFEIISGGGSAAAGQRIVILKYAGASRYLHLATNRGRLQISTSGETHGHAATSHANSFGVAAASAQINPLNPFNTTTTVETFSSDGLRRIFFRGDGTQITPGNLTSSGGQVLLKPDITAADGVSVTGVGGFPSPFYGTSAAAPHAAAIAALVLSRNLALTPAQIRTALLAAAIDIEGAGFDRDSGFGVVMADAVAAIPPLITGQPANQRVRRGQTATFTISAISATSYQWQRSTDGGASWANVINAPPFSGAGTSTLTVVNVGAMNLMRFRCIATNSFGPSTSRAAILNVIDAAPNGADFDGDGRAEVTVFRPSTGTWWVKLSSANFSTFFSQQWGMSTDVPVPGDYDGDGKQDFGIYRPSTGTWWVLLSSTNYTTSIAKQWGVSTDIAVPADYDGDGKTDLGIYRPSTGTWWVLLSSTNYTTSIAKQWGASTDRPVAGDYDGDGKADLGIYRPSTGTWWMLLSSTNYTTSIAKQWGVSTDIAVPADYDGDGKTDLGMYRPSTGTWWVLLSSTNYTTSIAQAWGVSTDRPVPGDYDGDGREDFAVYRPSNGMWYIAASTAGGMQTQWGTAGDVPVPPR